MSRHRRLALAFPVIAVAVLFSGCGQGAASDDPVATPTSPPTPPGPPLPTTTWQPSPPVRPVEPDSVRSEYDATLDAAIDSLASGGAALSWPGRGRESTERFAGVCVVKLERVGSGALSPDVDALQQSLATAVTGSGFADLAIENDPGGALLFVAHDPRDALFEFRSKVETTVSVRVATADSECAS